MEQPPQLREDKRKTPGHQRRDRPRGAVSPAPGTTVLTKMVSMRGPGTGSHHHPPPKPPQLCQPPNVWLLHQVGPSSPAGTAWLQQLPARSRWRPLWSPLEQACPASALRDRPSLWERRAACLNGRPALRAPLGPPHPSLFLSPGTPHKLGRVRERPNWAGDPTQQGRRGHDGVMWKVDKPPTSLPPLASIWGTEAKAALPGCSLTRKQGGAGPPRAPPEPVREHLGTSPRRAAGKDTPLACRAHVPVAVLQVWMEPRPSQHYLLGCRERRLRLSSSWTGT